MYPWEIWSCDSRLCKTGFGRGPGRNRTWLHLMVMRFCIRFHQVLFWYSVNQPSSILVQGVYLNRWRLLKLSRTATGDDLGDDGVLSDIPMRRLVLRVEDHLLTSFSSLFITGLWISWTVAAVCQKRLSEVSLLNFHFFFGSKSPSVRTCCFISPEIHLKITLVVVGGHWFRQIGWFFLCRTHV